MLNMRKIIFGLLLLLIIVPVYFNYKKEQRSAYVTTSIYDDTSTPQEDIKTKKVKEINPLTKDWNVFTSPVGMTIRYPEGWRVTDASYEYNGNKALHVWVYGPKREAPDLHGDTQAEFTMPVCYFSDTEEFSNECYGNGESLSLTYPSYGGHAPNAVYLREDNIKETEKYRTAIFEEEHKTAIMIMETARIQ